MTARTISHYRVLELIGCGGMGEVYEAQDLALGRRVALKFLSPHLARSPEALKRFQMEARSASALNHPSICTIYEVGEEDGQHFIAMELLRGKGLDRRLQLGALEPGEVVELGVQIADALDTAHSSGILHRDIKPANIFVTERGQAKVLDFGLAKLALEKEAVVGSAVPTAASYLTSPGVAIGTVAYMSPEQARGLELDKRTDLFSFGAVLYEMATGRRAFEGATSAVIFEAILNREPVPVAELRPELPPKLEEIITRALEKDREMRYQSAAEVRAELKRLQRDRSSGRTSAPSAARVSAGEAAASGRAEGAQPRPWPAKGPAIAAAAVLLVVAAALGIYRWRAPSGAKLAPEGMQITRLTQSGKATFAAISPDGRLVAYVLREGLDSLWIRQVATRSDVQLVPPAAARFLSVSFSPEGNYIYYVMQDYAQGNVILYQMPTLGGRPRLLARDIDTGVSVAPDGARVAHMRGAPSRGESYLVVSDLTGSEKVLATLAQPIPSSAPAWSPDGKTIVFAAESVGGPGLVAFSLSEGKLTRFFSSDRVPGTPVWLPEGGGLIVAMPEGSDNPRGQLWHVSFPKGESTRLTNDPVNYDLHSIDVTRDGKTLAVVAREESFEYWLVPARNAGRQRQLKLDADGLGVAWSGEGALLTRTQEGELWKVDPEGKNPPLHLTPAGHKVSWVSSCGERNALFVSSQGGLWMLNPDGSGARKVADRGRGFCSPDGAWILQGNWGGNVRAELHRIPLDEGAPRTLLQGKETELIFRPRISPDGRLIAFRSWDFSAPKWRERLVVIAAEDGSTKYSFDLPARESEGLGWAPDGSGLDLLVDREGVSNLWRQPLAGGEPKPVIGFRSGLFVDFHWSPRGKDLLLFRAKENSDVILISNFR